MDTTHVPSHSSGIARGVATIVTLLGTVALVLVPWLTANAAESPSIPSAQTTDVEVRVTLSDAAAQPPLLHLPENTGVTLVLEDVGDVAHEIVVPDLRIDIVAAPGERVLTHVPPTKVGVYRWFCTQPEHQASGMQGWVVVGGSVAEHQHSQ